MAKADAITVLIADDHFVARVGIKRFINAQPNMQVVAMAANGEQAIAAYRSHLPTVVVMDLRMQTLDGVRATVALRHFDKDARVLMLSSYDKPSDIQRAQESGALGYITKEADPSELLHAVRTVAEGQGYISPRLSPLLGGLGPAGGLSPREVRILDMISSGQSSRDIAAQMNLTPGTMRVYVHQIMAKMGVSNRAAAVSAAIREGIITSVRQG
ncbi:MAG: response regulator transcription factor [Deltaproteobacteria bacterium]|nr:response regulator transcription factor [Deltaproteobacteria bacterium]